MNLLASLLDSPSQTYVPLSWVLGIALLLLISFISVCGFLIGDGRHWRKEAETWKASAEEADNALRITQKQRDHSREEFSRLTRKYALCLKAVMTCGPAKASIVNGLTVNHGELTYDRKAVEAAREAVSPLLTEKPCPKILAAMTAEALAE